MTSTACLLYFPYVVGGSSVFSVSYLGSPEYGTLFYGPFGQPTSTRVFEDSECGDLTHSEDEYVKKQGEEHYWSRFAESYDRDGEYVIGKRIIQVIEEALLRERSLGRTIEFGCGTGTFTKAIARNAGHLVASDLSNEMLEAARIQLRGFKNVTIQRADCKNTSFPAERFDSVFLTNLIHVIDNPLQCIRESHRILRSRGSLIIVDFTGYRLAFSKKMKLGLRYMRTWGLPPRGGRNNMSPEELVSLVEPSGFQVKGVQLLVGDGNALYLNGIKELQ